MISYLKGIIYSCEREKVIIVVNDSIGYSVFMHDRDLKTIVKGHGTELFCHHHITDRSHDLYGFLQDADKKFFVEIIDHVTGIGPKSALKILAKNTSQLLKEAVCAEDINRLISYGIGNKTGEKLIISLKDKIDSTGTYHAPVFNNTTYKEAIEALISLGYTNSEAEKSLSQIEIGSKKTETLVKEALRFL